jgi:hypothetical protein
LTVSLSLFHQYDSGANEQSLVQISLLSMMFTLMLSAH